MPCDVKELELASFFDGELPAAAQANMARHIALCSSCTQSLRNFSAIRDGLKKEAPEVPEGLAARIGHALARDSSGGETLPSTIIPRWKLPRFAGLAASYAAVALLAGGISYFVLHQQQGIDAVNHDVVAAHVRALMQDAPYQVASSDQHTVKPWFAGRAEFSPQVRDFAAQGYSLVGGRMDYVDGHRVAAMVYRHNMHLIDLMMWPAASSDSAPQFSMSEGFQIASWIEGGLEARAISDMGADEMKAFAGLASTP